MVNKSIQMKALNGQKWENLFPYTYDENVFDQNGITAFQKFDTFNKRTDSITDIKELGVLGDGTDETAKIKKAIETAKGTLKFSEGTYVISEPIVRTTSDLKLEFTSNAKMVFNGHPMEKAISFVGGEGTFTTLSADTVTGSNKMQVTAIPPDWKIGDWLEINSAELWSSTRVDYNKIEYVKIEDIDYGLRTITLYAGTVFGYGRTFSHKITKQNFLTNVEVVGMHLTAQESISTWGISFERCFMPRAINNRLYYTQLFGIDVRNCVFPHIEGNFVLITTNRDALNYGVVFTSCQYGNIIGNELHSFRTSIDLTRSSSFNNVTGNTSFIGDINTHNSLRNSINNNILNGGKILVRGPYHNVVGNFIRRRNEALYQGGITLDEAAEMGFINIVGNYIEGSEDFALSYGIYTTLLNIKEINIIGNFILNVTRGVFFGMPDNNGNAKNIVINDNKITLKIKAGLSGTGVHIQRVSNVMINNNQIVGAGEAGSTGILFFASGGAFKNLSINNNQIYGVGDPVNVGNYHSSVMCALNIADNCSGTFKCSASNRKLKDNILNGVHDTDNVV